MKTSQKRAISYAISRKTMERRLAVIDALDLREAFRRSKYSSPGWFLKSLGITVTYHHINIATSSPLANHPNALDLMAGGGRI